MPNELPSQTPAGYHELLASLKARIRDARFRSAFAVNRELISPSMDLVEMPSPLTIPITSRHNQSRQRRCAPILIGIAGTLIAFTHHP